MVEPSNPMGLNWAARRGAHANINKPTISAGVIRLGMLKIDVFTSRTFAAYYTLVKACLFLEMKSGLSDYHQDIAVALGIPA